MSTEQSTPLAAGEEPAGARKRELGRLDRRCRAGRLRAVLHRELPGGPRPARRQPERARPAAPGEVHLRAGLHHLPRRRHRRGAAHPAARVRQRLAAQSGQPGDADVPVHHADRVAGPDHELVAVRGLQPRPHPLAGVLAAGVVVADRRTVRRVRLRDVLLRPVLPGGLDSAQAAGEVRAYGLRGATPAGQPGSAGPGDRLRLRRVARDPRSCTPACTSIRR